MVIHRYSLTDYPIRSTSVVKDLPSDFKVLHVGMKGSELCVWAEVSRNKSITSVQFLVLETGVDFDITGFSYLGTVILDNDSRVYHVYVEHNIVSGLVSQTGTLPQASWTPVVSSVTYTPSTPSTVDSSQYPDGGLVFNYEKQDGSTRLVRLTRPVFFLKKGRQAVSGWDEDKKDWRTIYLDKIIDFPEVVAL